MNVTVDISYNGYNTNLTLVVNVIWLVDWISDFKRKKNT